MANRAVDVASKHARDFEDHLVAGTDTISGVTLAKDLTVKLQPMQNVDESRDVKVT
jgi:hypothetical protein